MNIDKLRSIWDGHSKAVYGYLLRLTKSEADACDFLQDLFHRLARQPELVERLDEEPRGYLLRLARNAVVDQVRRANARERVFEKIGASRPDETVDAEDPDNRLLREALVDAVRHLEKDQREVVYRKLWKRQTFDEMARELGISINTAASRYRYGIDKMRERLRSLYEDFAPGASKTQSTPIPKMKTNPKNPITSLNVEDPIILPLEQRRVPSATGAPLGIAILPVPEESGDPVLDEVEVYTDEAVVDDQPVEKGIEIGDLGEEVLLEEVIEVDPPINFDDVIQDFDYEEYGGGTLDLVGEDVFWAYDQIFATGGGVFNMTGEEGAEWEQPLVTECGFEYEGWFLPLEMPVDLGSGSDDGSVTDDGTVVDDGYVIDDGSGFDPAVCYMTGFEGLPDDGYVVDDGSELGGELYYGGDEVFVLEDYDPSIFYSFIPGAVDENGKPLDAEVDGGVVDDTYVDDTEVYYEDYDPNIYYTFFLDGGEVDGGAADGEEGGVVSDDTVIDDSTIEDYSEEWYVKDGVTTDDVETTDGEYVIPIRYFLGGAGTVGGEESIDDYSGEGSLDDYSVEFHPEMAYRSNVGIPSESSGELPLMMESPGFENYELASMSGAPVGSGVESLADSGDLEVQDAGAPSQAVQLEVVADHSASHAAVSADVRVDAGAGPIGGASSQAIEAGQLHATFSHPADAIGAAPVAETAHSDMRDFSVESTRIHGTVDHWVPLPDLDGGQGFNPEITVHDDFIPMDASGSLDVPVTADGGATLPEGAQPNIGGGPAAMAATGAALLGVEPKRRNKEAQG